MPIILIWGVGLHNLFKFIGGGGLRNAFQFEEGITYFNLAVGGTSLISILVEEASKIFQPVIPPPLIFFWNSPKRKVRFWHQSMKSKNGYL